MKVITVCGSFKYKQEMMEIGEVMQLQGNCVILPIFPTRRNISDYTESEIEMFGKMHKEKIKLSDAILVVNVNGYIGNATQSEIELAKSLNKEIIYYTDLLNQKLN